MTNRLSPEELAEIRNVVESYVFGSTKHTAEKLLAHIDALEEDVREWRNNSHELSEHYTYAKTRIKELEAELANEREKIEGLCNSDRGINEALTVVQNSQKHTQEYLDTLRAEDHHRIAVLQKALELCCEAQRTQRDDPYSQDYIEQAEREMEEQK
jgi:chromosome segregation ATPase